MFSNWFTKKQPIQPIQPPILMPPPKTFRDMTCGEIDKEIEQMDGKIDTITLGKRLHLCALKMRNRHHLRHS